MLFFCRSFVHHFNLSVCRDIPSSESSKFSNWLQRDLSAELLSKSQPDVSPISSNCDSDPAASVTIVSQQFQDLSVASTDVVLKVPSKPVSPAVDAVDSIPSAILPSLLFCFALSAFTGDDDTMANSESAPVASSQVCFFVFLCLVEALFTYC